MISYDFISFYLSPVCFVVRDRSAVDPDGKGNGKKLGGVEEGQLVIRRQYVRKRRIFSKRNIKINK